LQRYIQGEFAECDVFLSFSSEIIVKKLSQKGVKIKNLSHTLADADMLGYRKTAVAPVALFAADKQGVESAILTGTGGLSLLRELYTETKKEDTANLFVFHDTKSKNPSLKHLGQFLKELDSLNFSCAIKGESGFEAIKELLKRELFKKNIKNIQLIPMLLVSGSHYRNEISAIKESLAKDFEPYIAKSRSGGKFSLLELESVKEIIKRDIEGEFMKMS